MKSKIIAETAQKLTMNSKTINMPRTFNPKYVARVIKRDFITISNETCEPIEVSPEERLMDAIFGEKYCYVDLYTSLEIIWGKTLAEIETKSWEVARKNNTSDIEVFMIKK